LVFGVYVKAILGKNQGERAKIGSFWIALGVEAGERWKEVDKKGQVLCL